MESCARLCKNASFLPGAYALANLWQPYAASERITAAPKKRRPGQTIETQEAPAEAVEKAEAIKKRSGEPP